MTKIVTEKYVGQEVLPAENTPTKEKKAFTLKGRLLTIHTSCRLGERIAAIFTVMFSLGVALLSKHIRDAFLGRKVICLDIPQNKMELEVMLADMGVQKLKLILMPLALEMYKMAQKEEGNSRLNLAPEEFEEKIKTDFDKELNRHGLGHHINMTMHHIERLLQSVEESLEGLSNIDHEKFLQSFFCNLRQGLIQFANEHNRTPELLTPLTKTEKEELGTIIWNLAIKDDEFPDELKKDFDQINKIIRIVFMDMLDEELVNYVLQIFIRQHLDAVLNQFKHVQNFDRMHPSLKIDIAQDKMINSLKEDPDFRSYFKGLKDIEDYEFQQHIIWNFGKVYA